MSLQIFVILIPFHFFSTLFATNNYTEVSKNSSLKKLIINPPELEKFPPKVQYFLPRHIRPLRYDLTIKFPNEIAESFTGQSSIEIEILESSRNITLHSQNLVIKFCVLKDKNSLHTNDIQINSFFLNKTLNFLIIQLASDIARGNYSLTIDYDGRTGDSLRGLYRSYHLNELNEKV